MCEMLNRTVILPRFIVNQEDELKILPFFLFDINVLESEYGNNYRENISFFII